MRDFENGWRVEGGELAVGGEACEAGQGAGTVRTVWTVHLRVFGFQRFVTSESGEPIDSNRIQWCVLTLHITGLITGHFHIGISSLPTW